MDTGNCLIDEFARGVTEQSCSESSLDVALEELHIKGYTIMPSRLGIAELHKLREKILAIYETQSSELLNNNALEIIGDKSIARGLCAYDNVFLDILRDPNLNQIISKSLQQKFILISQNGIINSKYHAKSHNLFNWHRDLNYQHYVSSRPLALSVLLALDDFTEESGGTSILEGTHKIEALPSYEYIKNNKRTIQCPSGSWVIFDSMTFHRTGRNFQNHHRIAINHIFASPMFARPYSFKNMREQNGINSCEKFYSMILGYEYETKGSVLEWRKSKL